MRIRPVARIRESFGWWERGERREWLLDSSMCSTLDARIY
jgi:hypothetical protein